MLTTLVSGGRAVRFAAAIAATLALGACAKDQNADGSGFGAGGAATPGSAQDFVVNVGDRVYFDLDSYQVNPEAYPRLDAQAAWLARYPQIMVRIEGNADERGTREYNLALGARRAKAAQDFLVARGIASTRIRTISYGKERPVALCDQDSCWAQNRRAVTVLNTGG